MSIPDSACLLRRAFHCGRHSRAGHDRDRRTALGSGFRETFFMGLGLILGDLIYLTAVILGLAFVAQTFTTAFTVIKIAGALYLVYIAWKLWTAGILPQDLKARPSASMGMSFLSGLLVTLGNPKTMLFYVALVPTLIDLHSIGLADYGLLIAATFLVLLAVLLPYILLATRARLLLKQPRALKTLNRVAGRHPRRNGCLYRHPRSLKYSSRKLDVAATVFSFACPGCGIAALERHGSLTLLSSPRMEKGRTTMSETRKPGRGRVYSSITETIGDTPIVRLDKLAKEKGVKANLLAKLEFFNPIASVKDRIGVAMIESAGSRRARSRPARPR